MDNQQLVESARVNPFYLKFKAPRDETALEALGRVDRVHFLPRSVAHEVYMDLAVWLPRFPGASCSEPSLVAYTADRLDLFPGAHVLEIGTGCGYDAAVKSEVIGEEGTVTTVEINRRLGKEAMRNLANHFGAESFLQ